jgi:hypothetical protein
MTVILLVVIVLLIGIDVPYCSGKKIHLYNSLGWLYSDVLNIWSDKNKKSPYEYLPSSRKIVLWKCLENKHDDYYRDIKSSNTCDFRCPKCVQERYESILQEKVRIYLESLNNSKYTILHENKCTLVPQNPKTKHPLPFDNEIKELNLVVEIHGKQHYLLTSWCCLTAKNNNTAPEYEFNKRKLV